MTDEDLLRTLLETATADLAAPDLRLRPAPTVVPLPERSQPAGPTRRSWPRRIPLAVTAAAMGAAAAVAAMLAVGTGVASRSPHSGGSAGSLTPRAGPAQLQPQPQGRPVLIDLASEVRALPVPSGRYAVQVERQQEGSVSYLKATIIDSRTGDTWTYQRGAGVPSVLPMAPGFSPTEAQLQASDPTDPTQLRAALIAQATAAAPQGAAMHQTPDDLAVTEAINTLWNPLVQPALRAALVTVIASSPGVETDAHATDSSGRRAIRISYVDTGTGERLSVYLDPSTAAVLENSQRPSTAGADQATGGRDVYLSQYWTDAPPTTDPLSG